MPPVVSVKRPNDLKKTIHRLLSYMGRHKFLLFLVAVLVTFSAAANLIGTYLFKPIIDTYSKDPAYKNLWKAVLLEVGIYSIGVLSTLGYSQIMVRLSQKIIYEMRRDMFEHMQKLSLSYFDSRTHGQIMSNYTNDIDCLSDALNNAFAMLISNFIQIIGLITLLFVLNWLLSIVCFTFYILMFSYIFYASKKSKKAFARQQKVTGNVNGFVEEMLSGQKVVQVFNHEQDNIESFRKENEELKKAGYQALKYTMSMIPMVVSISYINYAIVAILGGLIALGYIPIVSFTLGGMASYLVFVRQAAMPINQFTQQSNLLLNGLAGAERLFLLMDEKFEIDEGNIHLIRLKNEKMWVWEKEDKSIVPLKGDVRFYDVDFSYHPNKKILKNLSLYAKPGQKIAFVGATGAGKTTITNLINRFYEIEGGTITYDGIDIKSIAKNDLRRSLAIVLQDTHLFSGSIMENIRYGRLDATDEEVIEAAKLANADGFIRRLPNGYQTYVSADGGNLSQGQCQLLSIARAALADTPVLILDEATSSIDTRTERLVQEGINNLMQGRTVFVIAHRLSTVRRSDAIMVLDKGNIIERGTHEDLLALKGIYYQLYTGKLELE
ncbi:MAG: ABC transporter ATP-binding protein/permease [Anaeroplasmataceae bacterium]|nr:ABC transporter ATP-binding protein/permease [Anaeroplasmataceae bacterium]